MRIDNRWAAIPTFLMALPNLAAGPTASPNDVPAAVAWAGTVVGAIGVVAGVALLRGLSWGRSAVLAVAVVNVVAAAVVLVAGWGAAGAVGVILGLAALALVIPTSSAQERTA